MRPQVVNGQIDRRGRSGWLHAGSDRICHCRVDERCRHAAVEDAAGMAKVVTHVDLDHGEIKLQIDESHAHQFCKR